MRRYAGLGITRAQQFHWLWASNTSSGFAMMAIGMVIRPIVVYELTGGKALAIGSVTFVMGIATLLLSPVGGLLADKYDRRTIMLSSQWVAVSVEGLLLFLLGSGRLALWSLLIGTAVVGSAFAIGTPARQASVTALVPASLLSQAISANSVSTNVVRLAAPATAGLMIACSGSLYAYSAMVLLHSLSIILLFQLPRLRPSNAGRTRDGYRGLADTIRLLTGSLSDVGLLIACGVMPLALTIPLQSLLPIFAIDVWHRGEAGLGALNTASGLGAIGGSLIASGIRSQCGDRPTLVLSVLTMCTSISLFSLIQAFGIALALLALAGAAAGILGVVTLGAIQERAPDDVRGRILAFHAMLHAIPMLMTFPLAAAADRYGTEPVCLAAAVLVAGMSMWILAKLGRLT